VGRAAECCKTLPGEYLSQALGVAAARLLELRIVKRISVASPAAGIEWSKKVPGGVVWELIGVQSLLTTSAAVANRNTRITIQDSDSNIVFAVSAGATVPASQAQRIGWFVGAGVTVTTFGIFAPLPTPPITLLSGDTLGSSTLSLDAADQWSGVFLTVREWSETDVIQEAMMIDAQLTALTEREVTGR